MLIPAIAIQQVATGASSVLGGYGGYVGESVREAIPYGPLFGYGLVCSLVSYFLMCVLVKALYAMFRKPVPFMAVLNIVSSALLVSTLVAVAAILTCLLFPPLSMFLLAIGVVGFTVSLYVGIQHGAQFAGASPFWAFLGMFATYSIVLTLTNIGFLVLALARNLT
ncbi:MAG: hypothetical protein FWD29_06250 [Micrococcales bacterium]|nr:hypothetical protein [Micrococcales bacterium]